jgi:hypothetical protein
METNEAAHDSSERQEAPEGRDTPVMGPRRRRKKVRPLGGEPAIDRPYDPAADRQRRDKDPWQDPGGPEPANG